MEILEQIKILEAEAKEGRIYKNKFLDLKREIEILINGLNKLLEVPSIKKKYDKNIEYLRPIAEKLYNAMKIKEIEIKSNHIKDALIADGYPTFNSYISGVRHLLTSFKGVLSKKEGHNIILYYFEPSNEIKIEKTSYMK